MFAFCIDFHHDLFLPNTVMVYVGSNSYPPLKNGNRCTGSDHTLVIYILQRILLSMALSCSFIKHISAAGHLRAPITAHCAHHLTSPHPLVAWAQPVRCHATFATQQCIDISHFWTLVLRACVRACDYFYACASPYFTVRDATFGVTFFDMLRRKRNKKSVENQESCLGGQRLELVQLSWITLQLRGFV